MYILMGLQASDENETPHPSSAGLERKISVSEVQFQPNHRIFFLRSNKNKSNLLLSLLCTAVRGFDSGLEKRHTSITGAFGVQIRNGELARLESLLRVLLPVL
jgi:hypothetical protein